MSQKLLNVNDYDVPQDRKRVIIIGYRKNLGKKFDLKNVKDGHARNFLIPRGLAKQATKEVMKWLETQKEIQAKKEEEQLKKIQKIASSIDGLEVIIPVKVGEKDQLFEKINSQKISEKIKEMGFDIKKEQLAIEEPLKEIGEFPIKVKFEHNLEAEIKIIINEEN